MRATLTAILLCGSVPAIAQQTASAPAFEWPEAEVGAIPDLRVAEDVNGARETARQASERASEGRRAAGQAKRRAGLQGAFGIKPRRATIDESTEIALTRGASEGARLGTIVYASGATMTGAFGPDVGVYTGGPQSPLGEFAGWVWGASTGTPRPIDGVFEWKNGDTFTGSITGDASASRGVYVKVGGQVRFVGTIDLSASPFRPVRGYVESASGKLLAIVRRN